MSTDYNIVCDTCRVRMHAGQRMGSGSSFGYGSVDAAGLRRVARFAFEVHGYCPGGLRLELMDVAEARTSDAYRVIDEDNPGDEATLGKPVDLTRKAR